MWRAEFPDEVTVEVDDDGSWTVHGSGDAADEVRDSIVFAYVDGWPEAPGGFSIDRSPGFDPEWMYPRLLAVGALSVEGPCPPCDEDDRLDGEWVA